MRKIHFTDKYLLSPYHPVTVLVAGAGGTGYQVITSLARMSVALQALGHPGLHLTAFDPDTVTEANIGRQLFSETELGLNKATALVTRVNRFFGYAWEARECRYPIITKEGDKSVPLANIIITCTDNTRSRLDLWRFLKKYREYKNNDEKAPIYWMDCKYSINSLVYWVTYVHNVVYSFYRSMIYCYINSTQRCAGSIVIDIIPTNGADKRKFFPFAPYFPVTNVIKRYFYPYFPAIIGIKGYSFPYFPYLSGIMKIKTALYSLFSRLDWHKTVVFPCLGEIYEGIRSLSWEIPVT